MGLPSITYNGTQFSFRLPPQNFIVQDSARRHDNVSTSGLRESVFEFNDILISFSMPGLVMGSDFTDWKNFYAWALQGGSFAFAPNVSVMTGAIWYFNCVLEDMGFKPKRVGLGRYSLDCKFRVVPGYSSAAPLPTNSGMIMDAFWGITPA